MSVFETLEQRGLIAQTTHPEKIEQLLESPTTFYIGFDPTADSLHIGHFLQMVVMSHLQKAGHRPIAVIGGGTAMVGDPSGRTDLRNMLTVEQIAHNAAQFKTQLSRLVDFSEGKALMVNNADWLMNLNYVNFLRDIGVHFSVNQMLTAECFKSRLERGLSFIEFNYMLMQSYDFLVLNSQHNCVMQLGGDDQWSNILGGIELIRRVNKKQAYGMTFTLLTTSDGKKMGKTAKGALWLDEEKCSVYDFFQYWRNVPDQDVCRLMKLVTFMPLEEIAEYEKLEGKELNVAKIKLAYEVTSLVHGEQKAVIARDAVAQVFSSGSGENMPFYEIAQEWLGEGRNVLDVLTEAKFIPSKAEGRRLIAQNGLIVGGSKVVDVNQLLTVADFCDNEIIAQRGKKNFIKLVLEPV